jgi:heparin binding hemagglutinin HbhA
MALSEQIEKTLRDPRPLYAVVGAGDLAVRKLRNAREEMERISQTLPDKAQEAISEVMEQASSSYAELAERGKDLFDRVRQQPSSQELEKQAQRTINRARSLRTTVRNSTDVTQRSFRHTAASARDTAQAAKDAVGDATEQVGEE